MNYPILPLPKRPVSQVIDLPKSKFETGTTPIESPVEAFSNIAPENPRHHPNLGSRSPEI